MSKVYVCPLCKTPSTLPQVICEVCECVQPLKEVNPFKLFSLSPSFHIDLERLDTIYYDFQRKLHPDKLREKPQAQQENAHRGIAYINFSYRVLKDPLWRAKAIYMYFTEPDQSVQRFPSKDNTLPMTFLSKVMMLQQSMQSRPTEEIIHTIQREYDQCFQDIDRAVQFQDMPKLHEIICKIPYYERLLKSQQE